jgi:hypothetical protein
MKIEINTISSKSYHFYIYRPLMPLYFLSSRQFILVKTSYPPLVDNLKASTGGQREAYGLATPNHPVLTRFTKRALKGH